MTRPAENQARGEAPTVAKLQQTVEALASKTFELADELQAALDDPKRYEWGDSPWEHLGDAERDVRLLLAGIAALRDLVAQAANAAELRRALTDIFLDPLTSHGGRARAREALGISFIPFASPQEMLARLDGAR